MIWFRDKTFSAQEYQIYAEELWKKLQENSPRWDGELNTNLAASASLSVFKNIHPRIWFYSLLCCQGEIQRLRRQLADYENKTN